MEPCHYRAVTLDAHGVLLLPDPAAFGDAVERFGAERDDERCWRAHYEMSELLDSMLDVDYERLNRSFAAALGIATDLHKEDTAIAFSTSASPVCMAMARTPRHRSRRSSLPCSYAD